MCAPLHATVIISNKITADVREAIIQAFGILGGAEYLRKVATEDPKAFCALLGKLIPVKVGGDAIASGKSVARHTQGTSASAARTTTLLVAA
jgi:hypothetical protein